MPRRLTFPPLRGVEAPLLPAGLFFLGGLFSASFRPFSHIYWIGLAIGCWALFIPLRRTRVAGAVLFLGFLGAGGACWSLQQIEADRYPLRELYECGEFRVDEPVELIGTLVMAPELAPDRLYLSLEVERATSLQRSHRVEGTVRLIVPFDDAPSRLEYDGLRLDYGARLRLLANLNMRGHYRNPGAPEFDEILESQGIVGTGWVKSPLLIERLGTGQRNRVLGWLYGLRGQAIRIVLRHFRQPASGLLAASLFGNRYFLSRETGESFRAGGTYHLLVISGAHIAIIAVAVLWMLGRLVDSRLIRYGGGLLLMWAYALMVGAQPAVTRSVVMLTVVLCGQYLFRPVNGANSLAGAAIVLLAWQPRDLFNPGFQVSFLTVAVIVLLTGPLAWRLREIGRWRPAALTPYPPRSPRMVKWVAETLFWDDWRFRREMRRERIRYRLIKARAARGLSRWRLQPALVWIGLTVLTTTGVQIALLPLMIGSFHRVSLLSPVINVIEAVMVTLLMAAGTFYLAAYLLAGGAAMKLAPAVDWLGSWTVRAGDAFVRWPGGSWRVPDYGDAAAWLYGAYGAAILALMLLLSEWNPLRKGDGPRDAWRRRWGRAAAWLAAGVVAVIGWLLVAYPISHDYEPGRLSLTFLDVGQGDAIVISFPRGKLMMVDSGGDPRFTRDDDDDGEAAFVEDRLGIAEAAVMPYLWRRGIKRLDWIVASHGDNDHAGGFAEIVRSFAIGEAWQSNSDQGLFAQAVREAGVQLKTIETGQRLEIDGVLLEALSSSGQGRSDNNDSLVLKLSYGRRAFLLTGDIEEEAEAGMLAAGSDVAADVLKVAHHGSRTSSSRGFLERVAARYAVISAAFPNSFGHPHPEVLARLREKGIAVRRTSSCGAITISTDGEDLRLRTYAPCGD